VYFIKFNLIFFLNQTKAVFYLFDYREKKPEPDLAT